MYPLGTMVRAVCLLALSCTASAGDMCKWVDEDGCVHYAEQCPPGVESETVTLQAPPSAEQAAHAADVYQAARERQEQWREEQSRSPIPFQSLPLRELGPLPDNAESEHLLTTGTLFGIHQANHTYSLSLFVRAKPNLPAGAVLEARFPDPSSRDAVIIVEKTYSPDERDMQFIAENMEVLYCANYDVVVNIYADVSKQRFLGSHRQTIQGRVDSRLLKRPEDFLEVLSYGLCPNEIAGKSAAELRALCEAAREKRLKPLRDAKIKACVEKEGNGREYCEQFYSTFGDATVHNRLYIPRMFDDLPECEAAREAEHAPSND